MSYITKNNSLSNKLCSTREWFIRYWDVSDGIDFEFYKALVSEILNKAKQKGIILETKASQLKFLFVAFEYGIFKTRDVLLLSKNQEDIDFLTQLLDTYNTYRNRAIIKKIRNNQLSMYYWLDYCAPTN